MKDKQTIIAEIQESLRSGVLTEADIKAFITTQPEPSPFIPAPQVPTNTPNKLSAVDVMFYIAGVVFFSTILSIIVQSWNDGNALVHIMLSAGIGIVLWTIVYSLLKSPHQSDIRKGLTNALLLTGSLLMIVGGYVVSNELVGGFGKINYLSGALTLGVLGAIHLGFDRLIKKDLTLLLGVLLAVAAFPALLFGFLQDSDVPMDIWAFILIITVLLLAYATRVITKINPDRQEIHSSFDSFAAFIGLMVMYISSFGDYGVAWLGALITTVFGIFYLSIISQNKHLLGTASFFLVVTVITISFKYFVGFGATTSLIIATAGLLGSAAIAASINKKYFKQA